jgi:hypothetical protein
LSRLPERLRERLAAVQGNHAFAGAAVVVVVLALVIGAKLRREAQPQAQVAPAATGATPEAARKAGVPAVAARSLPRTDGGRPIAAPYDGAQVAAVQTELAAGWGRALLATGRKAFGFGVSFTPDCDGSAFSAAVKQANKGDRDVLFALKPIACAGLKGARVKRLDARALARGELRWAAKVPAGAGACSVVFESCLAAKGATACRADDESLVSVPVVFKNGLVWSFAGLRASKKASPVERARKAADALASVLSSAERAALVPALQRSSAGVDLQTDGSRLGLQLTYETPAMCSTPAIASAGERR